MLFCKWGSLLFFQGESEIAKEYLDRSVYLAKKSSLHQVLTDAYQIQANIYTATQQTDASFLALKKALRSARLLPHLPYSKDILNQLATNYHAQGQLDSAIHFFQRLLPLKEKNNDTDGLISDLSALGNLYRERGSYELAQQQYIKALQHTETINDSFALMTLYSEIGILYESQQIIPLSRENFEKALNIAKAKENNFLIASCYKKLGNLAALENQTEKAIAYYQKSLALYEKLGHKINAADVQIQLSRFYQNKDQYQQAKSYLLEAISIRQQSKDRLSTLHAKLALGKLEILFGDPQTGIKIVQEGLPEYKKMKDQEGLQQSYSLLSIAYESLDKPQQALYYFREYTGIKDSLTSIQRTRVINELEEKYKSEKKDRELLQKNLEIHTKQKEIQQRNNQLLLLAGGSLFMAFLITFLLFVNQKNKLINRQKIEFLKKEQETRLLTAIIEGEEKELKRIGQELHDGLGAVLATIKMQISSISGKIPTIKENPGYQKAAELIDAACGTIREISHGMMPYILEHQGLEYAIEDLCQTISNTKNIEVHFNPYQVDLIQSDMLTITIYRITQELLKNILKHAQASEIIVQLTVADNEIDLLVEDNGKGFDPKTEYKGIGLNNIRSRVNYLKGSMEIDSKIEEGSTFLIKLPLT